jgi:hypothetical protein
VARHGFSQSTVLDRFASLSSPELFPNVAEARERSCSQSGEALFANNAMLVKTSKQGQSPAEFICRVAEGKTAKHQHQAAPSHPPNAKQRN